VADSATFVPEDRPVVLADLIIVLAGVPRR